MKQLYRSRRDRVIGGVCGGVAEYFETDPALIRLLWVLIVLLGGSGLLLYIIAWIIIPERPISRPTTSTPEASQEPSNGSEESRESTPFQTEHQPVPPPRPVDPQRRVRWGGIILILLGAYLLIDRFVGFDLSAWWPVLLILFGLALLVSAGSASEQPLAPPDPSHLRSEEEPSETSAAVSETTEDEPSAEEDERPKD